jgi:WD40 repeat protein
MPQRLRVFVSSPADVPEERLRADLIVDKLSQDYSRFFTIESYRWEHEAMLASKHFQDAIEPPSAFGIVVLILWSRLGTPLPEKTSEREYRGIDGRAPVTGTEWEYEEALKVAREKGAPDLLAFRNISPAPIDPCDPDAQDKTNAQLKALNAFWKRHFADRGVFLAAYDEYRTLEEFAQRLEQSLRKLIQRRIKMFAAAVSEAPIWLGAPFRGLESYEFEHAAIFFGRDAAVTKAIEQLAANARSGCAFLLVSGASGSGKSSLVKAGVAPRLMKPQRISGAAFLRTCVFRPAVTGNGVFLGLATALTRAAGPDTGLPELIAPGQDAAQFARHLRGTEPGYLFANALGRLTKAERTSGRLLGFENAKLILVVDQFEELFTIPGISPEDRRLFVQLLAGLARSGAVWVIATLRADFWHRAAEIPELIAVSEGYGRIDLAAATAAELAEMIRKPAQAAGLIFGVHPQTGLGLDAVLAQHAAAAPGALPLLSFTLDELYKNAKAGGETVLTHASYEALGGLEGAIANRADEIVAGLPASAHAALPRVLRALTTVASASDRVPVARSVPLDTFAVGSPARILVDALVAARLLVAGGETGAPSTVRLAHEALISRWQRARDQLAADRRDLETRTVVEREFGRWTQARGYARWLLLLRNPDLANAVDLAKRWGDEIDVSMRDFIKWSARRARLVQSLTAAAAVLLAIVAGAAFIAEQQAVRAQREAFRAQHETERRQVNLLAELTTSEGLRGHLDTALKLGVHAARSALALEQDGAGVSAPRTALASAVWQSNWRVMLGGHESDVMSAAFSPDGTRIVTASWDKTARIWDAATAKETAVLRGHDREVTSAAFSPDGSRLVTASYDQTARIWDAATATEIAVLRGPVLSAAFSPDGSRIVTASDDTTARIWDAVTAKETAVLRGHGASVTSAAFSPDGSRIVTASFDKTARIWDAATATEIAVLRGPDAYVTSAAFSPDGSRIVTASWDKTARIWDAATAKETAVLRGHDREVTSAAFSPDGSRIVTASYDNTARIWDAATAKEIAVLRGHDRTVYSAAFSPDGSRIVTASNDKTGRIWDAATPKEIAVLRGHNHRVNSAAFSPNGSRIVTASSDWTARIWDAATATEITVLRGHHNSVTSAAFSPDGSRIVTASWDITARVWDAATATEPAVLRGHELSVNSAAFSPDGSRIVTASDDQTARIWDAAAAKEIAVLRGHELSVNSAAFSPDGSRIVTASEDNTARIWDAATAKEIAVLRGHDRTVYSAAFSPDGSRIVTASEDWTARIWDAATATEIAVLRGHHNSVTSAAFSPDGSRIVTASEDNTVRIWDAATATETAMLRGHELPANSAAFSPDGSRIVTASGDETARTWDAHLLTLSAKSLLAEACARLSGLAKLTRGEMRLAGYQDSRPEIDVCE